MSKPKVIDERCACGQTVRRVRGYRVRVVVDIPVWVDNTENAIKSAEAAVESALSWNPNTLHSKVMDATVILKTKPDNIKIFPNYDVDTRRKGRLKALEGRLNTIRNDVQKLTDILALLEGKTT